MCFRVLVVHSAGTASIRQYFCLAVLIIISYHRCQHILVRATSMDLLRLLFGELVFITQHMKEFMLVIRSKSMVRMK